MSRVREFQDADYNHAANQGRDNRRQRATVPESEPSGPLAQGKIKRIDRDKGFGFIRADSGEEYFFHRSETHGAFDLMQENDRVEFSPRKSPKGPRAHDVNRI